ncbi:MAG: T9SS type A sorting domain-containing protein [Candidatus Cloacimonetes bacterium]|nr:T9SS type A sorting domain-containing protein [Candidatus Cloacimonadota bacterium]
MSKMQPANCFALIIMMFIALTSPLSGQSLLANPSFEVTGTGGNIFAGWNQFGIVASDPEAYHGSYAARVSGADQGGWDLSAFWQQLDCAAGEQWEITGHVMPSAGSPLTGACIALVNLEWYNASGTMIDYQSFTVADASSPSDEYLDFALLSDPAPQGTTSIHLLTGVLQSPADPAPDVLFDQITLYSTTPPTIDDVQWTDFPDGRTIEFSDRTWRVKGTGWYGPGPNNFSHTPECVWVDENQKLHMTIRNIQNIWYCTEVVLEEALGYGDYIFTTIGDLNQIDIRTVLGLFLWQYDTSYDGSYMWWNPYNEIDVEFSRWGQPGNDIGQFVAQPWDWEGNLIRFDAEFTEDELSSHAFNWLPDRVEFRSWHGGPDDESAENMIFQWIYTGQHIPRPEQPRVHINLWQFGTPPVTDQEVIIDQFTFRSHSVDVAQNELAPEHQAAPDLHLSNYPNPFNPETIIRFDLAVDSRQTVISIYNLKGQLIYSETLNTLAKGQHQIVWNGRTNSGNSVSSGIYFYRLNIDGIISAKNQMLLLK